jgi:hypothetical protein
VITAAAASIIAGNFEKFCVMEQRGFVSMALEVPEAPGEFWRGYAQAVAAFNQAFDEHQTARIAYMADLQAQTRTAALALDKKHDDLMKNFLALKPWIMKAREELANSGNT